jgi:hypothetical protein
MLSSAETNAFGAKIKGFLGIGWSIGVRSHAQLAEFISPGEELPNLIGEAWLN